MRWQRKGKQQTNIKESRGTPYVSMSILGVILLGCLFANLIMPYDPAYMNFSEISRQPAMNHIFGTDTLGRDLFSMIWYGGRISLFIGLLATTISTAIAVVYGCISGLAGEFLDAMMMRLTEIALSIPSILIVIFVQAMVGKTNVVTIAFVIGITSWMNISKIIRSEVRQIRSSEYILAARTMGGGFFYILRRHLFPNFISSIMFMVVTNIGQAIGTEATLSFLGIGLPVEMISWGSMMALSQEALLSNFWWIILIPGLFLITTLVCITNVGNYIRKKNNREFSNL